MSSRKRTTNYLYQFKIRPPFACGDGGLVIEDGTDPTYCNNVVTILPPTAEEMEELMLNALYDILTDPSLDNNQKAKCIYDKLAINQHFKKLVHQFAENPTSDQLHLNFKIEELNPSSINGITYSVDGTYGNVEIVIDRTNLSVQRTVQIAGTFLHEAVHASFYAYLYTHSIKTSAQLNLLQDNFPALWNEYVSAKTGTPAEMLSDAQHNLMANEYVEVIARGIQEFDTQNHNNPEITMDHYRSLAWTGLKGDQSDPSSQTRAWKSLTTQQQQKIINDKQFFVIDSGYAFYNCN